MLYKVRASKCQIKVVRFIASKKLQELLASQIVKVSKVSKSQQFVDMCIVHLKSGLSTAVKSLSMIEINPSSPTNTIKYLIIQGILALMLRSFACSLFANCNVLSLAQTIHLSGLQYLVALEFINHQPRLLVCIDAPPKAQHPDASEPGLAAGIKSIQAGVAIRKRPTQAQPAAAPTKKRRYDSARFAVELGVQAEGPQATYQVRVASL